MYFFNYTYLNSISIFITLSLFIFHANIIVKFFYLFSYIKKRDLYISQNNCNIFIVFFHFHVNQKKFMDIFFKNHAKLTTSEYLSYPIMVCSNIYFALSSYIKGFSIAVLKCVNNSFFTFPFLAKVAASLNVICLFFIALGKSSSKPYVPSHIKYYYVIHFHHFVEYSIGI